jgi:hypothetical protein
MMPGYLIWSLELFRHQRAPEPAWGRRKDSARACQFTRSPEAFFSSSIQADRGRQ